MDTCVRASGKPGGAKAQKRTISMPSMVLGRGLEIFPASAKALALAGRYQPETYCFAPEGSSLDRCVTLNCIIWVATKYMVSFISKRNGSVKRATDRVFLFAVVFEKMTSVFRL